eukprot:131624_1
MACSMKLNMFLLLIFVINITNQTDCGPQMELFSDNAADMTMNWVFNNGGNSHAYSVNGTKTGICDTNACYEMEFSIDGGGIGATANFETNPNLFNTISYNDITIKYDIKQAKTTFYSTDNITCGTSYSVNNANFTQIDMRPAVNAQDDIWIPISQTLGTDAAHTDNITIRWDIISNQENAYSECFIDEIKLCGTLSGTLQPSKAPTPQTAPPTKIPTLPSASPTKSPTEPPIEPCVYKEGYFMEGFPASASGDPHFITWDNGRHHFMGIGDDIKPNQQFYYMHPCKGTTRRQMPFTLLGRHVQIASSSLTSLDYITLELFDFNGDEYLIWLSSSINSWTKFSPSIPETSTLYDASTNDKTQYQNLISGQEINIGSRFRAYYNKVISYVNTQQIVKINFKLTVVGNNFGECNLEFSMQAQDRPLRARNQIHVISVIPPACYKCYICGLFGDFQSNTPTNMQRCDGSDQTYTGDWTQHAPAAYDMNGWGWEKEYVKTNCPIDANLPRRLQNNEYQIAIPDEFVYIDPCPSRIKSRIENECQIARNKESKCCNIIGKDVCDALQIGNCNVDVCVAVIGNETQVNINNQINALFVQAIQLLCTLPGAEMYFDINNLIEAEPIKTTSSPNIIITTDHNNNITSTRNENFNNTENFNHTENVNNHNENSNSDENDSDS